MARIINGGFKVKPGERLKSKTGPVTVQPRPFRAIAAAIARDLFTDGAGNRADRLAMKHGNQVETEGSGWCEKAVSDRIEDHLVRAANTTAHGNG